jgi:hypothetical protein
MNALKTDYKNDIFTGPRKYQKTDNTDGTISLNDVTTYEVTGDIYAAADINAANQAVNEFYVEFNTTVNKLTNVLEMTLPAANWNSTAPFIQTITMPTIKATDTPVPGIVYPTTLTESLKAQIDKSANMITDIETLNGSIKVTCQFKKPVTDMTISLKGV